ncbi:unnamed protein product [Tuber aestivum]|uniref:Uncharacterized protein n=1 Tax=Tuber aestivum TaxID=59557 RepID=A0A292PJ88_9PEZI|nr:unnamed protein product [Tuber aestivum]
MLHIPNARARTTTSRHIIRCQQDRRDEVPREGPEREEVSKACGGLDVGLYSVLVGENGDAVSAGRGKGVILFEFATTVANGSAKGKCGKKRLEIQGLSADMTDYSKNLYFDLNLASNVVVPCRISQALALNQKGKYIGKENTLRPSWLGDSLSHCEPPPKIERWDRGLTTASSYEAITLESLLISAADGIVTQYVQHSVLLAPWDQLAPPMEPFRLTKKDQKKVRRRQRQRLRPKSKASEIPTRPGTPPPPNLKESNLIRVFGEEAVNDPAAVEPPENDLARGIDVLALRIETLANRRYRHEININSEQLALMGIFILNPKFNVVIVQGGIHFITKFRKPMKWFERFITERVLSDALVGDRLERARMEYSYMWTQAKNTVAKEG